MLKNFTNKEISVNKKIESINITSIEQLKLLETLSQDIENTYYDRPQKEYIDISSFSNNIKSEAQINMNMFFNNDLIENTYNKKFCRSRFYGLFNDNDSTFSIEYPNEVQVYLKEEVNKVLKEIAKRGEGKSGKLTTRANIMLKYGNSKIRNICACFMLNYFWKIDYLFRERKINEADIDEKIQILINNISYIVDILYPFAEYYINKYCNCHQFSGFLARENENKNIFKSMIEFNKQSCLSKIMKSTEIIFPCFDSKIPKIQLEYKNNYYGNRLKKYVEDNIDSSDVYPCLEEFKDFLKSDKFSKDDYEIYEDSNSFMLRNCWMMQALGTLKMLKDIDQDNVINGFEFTQFKSLEEAYDNGTFYYPIDLKSIGNNETKYVELNSKLIDQILKEKDRGVDYKVNDDGDIRKLISSLKKYLLKNISTFIAYNGIKYFYSIIFNKGRNQKEFDIQNYEIEEIDDILIVRVDIDRAFNIIHSRCYAKFLFSVAEAYKNDYTEDFEKKCIILCKRLILKKDKEASTEGYGHIKSNLFLPAFLPIYASIPDQHIDFFENNYKQFKNSSFFIVNGKLAAKKELLAEDFKLELKIINNFKHLMDFATTLEDALSFMKSPKTQENTE